MKLADIPQDKEGIEFIAAQIYIKLVGDSADNALADMLGVKPNPLKGKCYEASALMYDIFGSKLLTLYRKKDFEGIYHWWCIDKWNRVIDITAEQYEIEGHEVPSSNMENAEKQYPMSFMSYRKKVNILKGNLRIHLDKL